MKLYENGNYEAVDAQNMPFVQIVAGKFTGQPCDDLSSETSDVHGSVQMRKQEEDRMMMIQRRNPRSGHDRKRQNGQKYANVRELLQREMRNQPIS
jgi:hypothetical protein